MKVPTFLLLAVFAALALAVPTSGQEPLLGPAPDDWQIDETPTLWYNATEATLADGTVVPSRWAVA